MPLSSVEALAKVDVLSTGLAQQSLDVSKPLDYYEGKHSMAFASAEFQAAFGGLFSGWSDNWCGVVVDSVAERLGVAGFRLAGETSGAASTWDLWTRSNADADLDTALATALAAGRSSAIIWYPSDDSGVPEITFEHPTQVFVEYEPGNVRKRVAALKVWTDGTTDFATLFTTDEVWKFGRRRGSSKWDQRWPSEDSAWPLRHDFGAVPVVELLNVPKLNVVGTPASEIAQVMPMQDAINLLWAHVMTASDSAALPQRVLIGVDYPKVPIIGEDGKVSQRDATEDEVRRMRERRMGFIPNPNAKAEEWSASNLGGIVDTIRVQVQHVAAQSKTPPHYLLGQMANLSGEALAAAETGLVSKVHRRQVRFGDPIKEIMRLAHIAVGDPSTAAALAGGSVVWKDAEHRSISELVDALTKQMSIGVPMVALWEQLPGVDQPEIERWLSLRGSMAAASAPPVSDPATD